MTLNVSLRVPDGIVLASDSLGTVVQTFQTKMNVNTTCAKCGDPVVLKDVQTPPVNVPASTWPYVQKMYSLKKKMGLATFGSGLVNRRSIYNHIVGLENSFPDNERPEGDFEGVRDFLIHYFKDQLMREWAANNINEAMQPDDFWPFGFQLVGFRSAQNGDPIPTTCYFRIGKQPSAETYENIGCTCSGDSSVVTMLWKGGNPNANFGVFSLQDAIDYAKFLIRTTSDHQRFSGRLPTVGGDIDVALVTFHQGFCWIAQKELYRILDH